jgi:hypothetical protein
VEIGAEADIGIAEIEMLVGRIEIREWCMVYLRFLDFSKSFHCFSVHYGTIGEKRLKYFVRNLPDYTES